MSGVSGLVDTLLAERLSQRTDLVALKSAFVVQGPGPAGRIQEVANDVRIQAEAAKQQHPGLAGSGDRASKPAEPSIFLSSAAHVIARLLSLVPEGAPPVAGRALLPGPANTIDAAAAARALQAAVTTSGLFYESHLAGLATGQFVLADLQGEPQIRWPIQGAEISRALAGEGSPPALNGAVVHANAASAAGQPLSLVHQQLELLASGVFRWVGEAWPGVPMQLAIEPEHRERDEPSFDAAAPCSASFHLELPALGAVEVTVRLNGTQDGRTLVHVKVVAEPQAARDLSERLSDVAQSLMGAGFSAPQIAVQPRAVTT